MLLSVQVRSVAKHLESSNYDPLYRGSAAENVAVTIRATTLTLQYNRAEILQKFHRFCQNLTFSGELNFGLS